MNAPLTDLNPGSAVADTPLYFTIQLSALSTVHRWATDAKGLRMGQAK